MSEEKILLRARDVRELTGLGYETCLRLVKKYGVRFGSRGYYITRKKLEKVLDEIEAEGGDW